MGTIGRQRAPDRNLLSEPPRVTDAGPAPPVTEDTIKTLLEAELAPTSLVVNDVSGGCGSFFEVAVVCEAFNGLSMIKQVSAAPRSDPL